MSLRIQVQCNIDLTAKIIAHAVTTTCRVSSRGGSPKDKEKEERREKRREREREREREERGRMGAI